MRSKICKKCGEEKPLNEFKYNINKDYYTGSCKKCINKSAKNANRYQDNNFIKINGIEIF